MKRTVNLSNFGQLREELGQLERAGQWSQIEQLADSSLYEDDICKSILFRAFAYSGNWERIQASCEQEFQCGEAVCRYLLSKAVYYRRKSKFSEALDVLARALSKISSSSDKYLHLECQMERALIYADQGKVFKAVSTLRRLQTLGLSEYRQTLCNTNLALLFWELGQVEPLRRLLANNQLNLKIRSRVEILLALYDWDEVKLHQLYSNQTLSLIDEVSKKELCVLFCEWVVLSDRFHFSDFKHSWMIETIFGLEGNDPFSFLKELVKFGRLSDDKANVYDWRTITEYYFLKSLFDGDQRYYKTALDLLSENDLESPLIACERPSPWSKKVRHRVFGGAVEDSQLPMVAYLSREKKLRFEGKLLAIGPRPVLRKLVEYLIESKTKIINKRSIHKILTGTRYIPGLHDDRLNKFIKRNNDKFAEIFGHTLFDWIGDNTLSVNFLIDSE